MVEYSHANDLVLVLKLRLSSFNISLLRTKAMTTRASAGTASVAVMASTGKTQVVQLSDILMDLEMQSYSTHHKIFLAWMD